LTTLAAGLLARSSRKADIFLTIERCMTGTMAIPVVEFYIWGYKIQ